MVVGAYCRTGRMPGVSMSRGATMLHKRERFERSDVSKSMAGGTALAVGVLIFLVVGVAIGFAWARSRSGIDSSLSDAGLTSAVASQAAVAGPGDGYTASTDTFTNVLLLTVDDLDAESPTLTSAQLLSINVSAGTGTLVSLPLDTQLTTEAGNTTLAALFASSGASACIAPVAAATNTQLSHAIVATSEIWDKLASYKGSGVHAILGSDSELISSIKTDMDNDQLMDVAELVQSTGVANWTRADAPVSAGSLDDGTATSVIDATQLDAQIGTLVAA